MKTKHPCTICGVRDMAHPDNYCANCYLATQIVGGIRDRAETENMFLETGQHDRIEPLANSIRKVTEMVTTGGYKLVKR